MINISMDFTSLYPTTIYRQVSNSLIRSIKIRKLLNRINGTEKTDI